MRWFLRRIRGPVWYVLNILSECWRFNLRDKADRPGQGPFKAACYKVVITMETLLEAAFLCALITFLGVSAAAFLPSRWVYLEIRDTWSSA